jgi:hypothetical protein
MKILPHKLTTTNDQLTSRAGLPAIAQVMQQLRPGGHIDQQFPLPGSNRGFKPSEYLETLILMQHGGSFHLDDVRHLHDEEGLRSVLGLESLPKAGALGGWLRRTGKQTEAFCLPGQAVWQLGGGTHLDTTLRPMVQQQSEAALLAVSLSLLLGYVLRQ